MLSKLTVATLFVFSASAQAGVIIGGSTLLDNRSLSLLETWGGQGQMTLTKIFTKTRGSTSAQAHFAMDGKGPTFSLFNASEDNGITWKTMGGYNPQSWKSDGSVNYPSDPADWTAFVFNLSDSKVWRQNSRNQTVNHPSWAINFGDSDLRIDANLSIGVSNGFSYGEGCYGPNGFNGKECQRSFVDGSRENGVNMLVGAFEVFTVTSTPVVAIPEPGSLFLLGTGLFGLCAMRRSKERPARAGEVSTLEPG